MAARGLAAAFLSAEVRIIPVAGWRMCLSLLLALLHEGLPPGFSLLGDHAFETILVGLNLTQALGFLSLCG